MRFLLAVLRRELVVLWASPVPYVAGAVFHVALGLLAVDTMQARQQAVFQPVVPIAGFLLLVAVPVVGMRTLADERRTGNLDLLLAVPVRTGSLVVGKWLASLATVLVLLAPLGFHALLLAWWGEPDPGPIVSGVVGLVLLAAAALAVSVIASALTASQPVAALTAMFVLLAGWFLRPATSSVTLRTATARLSLNERLRTFAAGAIDLGAVTFLVGITVVGVLGAVALVSRRRRSRGLRSGLGPLVLVVVAVAVLTGQWAVDERRRQLDLTAERSLSLTEETEEVVDELDESVRITAFVRADAPGRVEAAALLDRYEALDRRIDARIVDPATSPGEMRRLGVDPTVGGVVLEGESRTEIVASPIEQDLTLGLVRIVRGDLPTVCLTTGHGELDPGSQTAVGASRAVGVLRDNGYEVVAVDLLAGGELDGCAATLVLGPASPFGRGADDLAEHASDPNGRVALFLEPGFDPDLAPLAADAGIDVLDGVVVEQEASSVFVDDPTAPIVRRYAAASPVVRNLPPTFFVTVGGLEVDAGTEGGHTLARLADTSPESVLVDDGAVAATGPITVAAASEISANVEGRPQRRRLVVVADVDVVSNAFVGEAGNARLLVQIVDWLTVDDDLVSVTSNLAAPRPLQLTDARRDYARFLTAGLVPAAFLVAGGLVWAVRRPR